MGGSKRAKILSMFAKRETTRFFFGAVRDVGKLVEDAMILLRLWASDLASSISDGSIVLEAPGDFSVMTRSSIMPWIFFKRETARLWSEVALCLFASLVIISVKFVAAWRAAFTSLMSKSNAGEGGMIVGIGCIM